MRYESGHKARTREQIIHHAAQGIRAVGPDQLGVAEVMAKVGLTHGGFYAHFRSKEDLIAAAIGHMFDAQRNRAGLPETAVDPASELVDFVNDYLSTAHVEADRGGCPIPALLSEVPRLSPALQDAFKAGTDRFVGEIANHVRKLGMHRSKAMARAIAAQMAGVIATARTMPDSKQADALLRDARASVLGKLGLA